MGLITWLAGALASTFSASVLRFVAYKVLGFTLFAVILPIVLNNFVYKMMGHAMQLATDVQSQYGLQSGFIIQFTGLGAWFATYLRIPEGIALIMSAVLFRASMRWVGAIARPSMGV